jgi:hypothetical protein
MRCAVLYARALFECFLFVFNLQGTSNFGKLRSHRDHTKNTLPLIKAALVENGPFSIGAKLKTEPQPGQIRESN